MNTLIVLKLIDGIPCRRVTSLSFICTQQVKRNVASNEVGTTERQGFLSKGQLCFIGVRGYPGEVGRGP